MNKRIEFFRQFFAFPKISALSHVIGQGTRFVQRAIRMRRDRASLQEMPDHILKDIGISRFEILSVVRFNKIDIIRRQRY